MDSHNRKNKLHINYYMFLMDKSGCKEPFPNFFPYFHFLGLVYCMSIEGAAYKPI